MMAQKSEPSCTQSGNDCIQNGNAVDTVAAAIGRAIEEMGDEFDANRHECLETWTDFEVAQAINGPNYTLVPRDFYERLAAAALEAMADCSRPANKGEIRTSAAESRQSGAIGGPTIPPGWRITGPDACPACRGTGRSEPLPDFEGDDPKTMTVCTVSLCQLCGGSGATRTITNLSPRRRNLSTIVRRACKKWRPVFLTRKCPSGKDRIGENRPPGSDNLRTAGGAVEVTDDA